LEELQEALKTKNGKSPCEDNLNFELYTYAVESFHEILLVVVIEFIRWEKYGKNGKTVLSYLYTKKVTNKRWKTTDELAYLRVLHVINYIVKCLSKN